jgi:hypothetical protein
MPTSVMSRQFDPEAGLWKRLYRRWIAPICRWWQPVADKGRRDRRNDRALGLIVCNAIFLVFVIICFQFGVQGKLHGAPTHLWLYFTAGEVVIMVAYAVNAWMTRTLTAQLLRGMGRTVEIPDRPAGYSVPIEAFGVVNAFAVGFITYFTGGPSNSPYAQVLVAMLLIAEQTRTIKEPDEEEKLSRVLTQPFKEFRTFLLITASFYLVLGILQWRFPISAKTAPAGVSIAITLIIFIVGTITTYVSASSRSRQASAAERVGAESGDTAETDDELSDDDPPQEGDKAAGGDENVGAGQGLGK